MRKVIEQKRKMKEIAFGGERIENTVTTYDVKIPKEFLMIERNIKTYLKNQLQENYEILRELGELADETSDKSKHSDVTNEEFIKERSTDLIDKEVFITGPFLTGLILENEFDIKPESDKVHLFFSYQVLLLFAIINYIQDYKSEGEEVPPSLEHIKEELLKGDLSFDIKDAMKKVVLEAYEGIKLLKTKGFENVNEKNKQSKFKTNISPETKLSFIYKGIELEAFVEDFFDKLEVIESLNFTYEQFWMEKDGVKGFKGGLYDLKQMLLHPSNVGLKKNELETLIEGFRLEKERGFTFKKVYKDLLFARLVESIASDPFQIKMLGTRKGVKNVKGRIELYLEKINRDVDDVDHKIKKTYLEKIKNKKINTEYELIFEYIYEYYRFFDVEKTTEEASLLKGIETGIIIKYDMLLKSINNPVYTDLDYVDKHYGHPSSEAIERLMSVDLKNKDRNLQEHVEEYDYIIKNYEYFYYSSLLDHYVKNDLYKLQKTSFIVTLPKVNTDDIYKNFRKILGLKRNIGVSDLLQIKNRIKMMKNYITSDGSDSMSKTQDGTMKLNEVKEVLFESIGIDLGKTSIQEVELVIDLLELGDKNTEKEIVEWIKNGLSEEGILFRISSNKILVEIREPNFPYSYFNDELIIKKTLGSERLLDEDGKRVSFKKIIESSNTLDIKEREGSFFVTLEENTTSFIGLVDCESDRLENYIEKIFKEKQSCLVDMLKKKIVQKGSGETIKIVRKY